MSGFVGPRDLLKESWQFLGEDDPEELRRMALELWRETLSASKTKQHKGRFNCRHCGEENLTVMEVEQPDLTTRTKAFEILANQAYGKPEETKTIVHDIGKVALEALGSMSTAELARYAGVDVVDGEFVELGAPVLPSVA